MTFQLTTSRRGRRKHYFIDTPLEILSTHDLTQRSTYFSFVCYSFSHLSTHDLTQRSTCKRLIVGEFNIFQLTTSRRGRPICFPYSAFLLIFQLTTSRRGRLGNTLIMISFYTFQLTTSRRGRPDGAAVWFVDRELSTHDLTQRSTGAPAGKQRAYDLSTHDLTQRSTLLFYYIHNTIKPFNSRPHAEVDAP